MKDEINNGKFSDIIREKGILVADNERYIIHDLRVKTLTVSLTELKSLQETRGHSHEENDEIYFFVEGNGNMLIENHGYNVEKGSVIFVPAGKFHKVRNLGQEKLLFVVVFEGDRSSKKYNYKNNRNL